MRVHVRAKINLSLSVLGRAADGYHELDMLLTSVRDVFDTVSYAPCDGIRVTMDGKECGAENTAYRAAEAIMAKYGTGADIAIEKGIPFGAGMGGSSADAAAALYCAREIYGLPKEELISVADSVGSDVAYMIEGGAAISRGRGSVIERTVLPPLTVAIIKAAGGCDTGEVFRKYDYAPTSRRVDSRALARAIAESVEYGELLFNALTEPAVRCNRNIEEVIAHVRGYTDKCVMTGSGSAVVGIFGSESEARDCVADIPKCAEYAIVTETCGSGVEVIE